MKYLVPGGVGEGGLACSTLAPGVRVVWSVDASEDAELVVSGGGVVGSLSSSSSLRMSISSSSSCGGAVTTTEGTGGVTGAGMSSGGTQPALTFTGFRVVPAYVVNRKHNTDDTVRPHSGRQNNSTTSSRGCISSCIV